MRKLLLVLLMIPVLGLFGCSTKSSYTTLPGATYVEPTATFSVGEVTDTSGYSFEPDDKDAFDLKVAMKTSLVETLQNKSAFNESGKYTIDVVILKYAPGNAGLRWLLPGAGATHLSVIATIFDSNKAPQAKIPVERSISAGGGYTIGAWKYVFKEVAEEIVTVLTDIKNRKAPKQ